VRHLIGLSVHGSEGTRFSHDLICDPLPALGQRIVPVDNKFVIQRGHGAERQARDGAPTSQLSSDYQPTIKCLY
jgi:hypothetical protein